MRGRAIQLIDNNDGGQLGDLKIDVVRDITGLITSGLVVGDTLVQNQWMILMSRPGELKFSPTLGVGLQDALFSDDLLGFRHLIRQQFKKDGLVLTEFDLYDIANINIKAKYNG
jgi:hypothetical protein